MSASLFTRDCLAGYPGSSRFFIGDFSYGAPMLAYSDSGAELHIGKFCSIGLQVAIYLGGNHRADWITTYPFSALSALFRTSHQHIKGHPATKGDVHIGNDVWIANSATILSGVTIGDGAVIGCGALVSKDIPPYAIAAGNPAKVIRTRFAESIVERLLAIRWWDWDIESINDAVPLLMSGDFETFFRHAESRQA